MNAQEHRANLLADLQSKLYEATAEIEGLKKQMAALEAELAEPVKWEPDNGQYVVRESGKVECIDFFHQDYIANGHAYQTFEKAEAAAAAMRPCNRLIAYLMEHDEPGDWYPVFSHGVREWCAARAMPGRRDPTKQYRSEHVIRELCRRLNEGEVVL